MVNVKKALVKSCLEGNAKLFLHYLQSPKVKVVAKWKNKLFYFHYFDYMLKSAHENRAGNLFLKIERPDWEKDEAVVYYEFYDSVYKSRLSILVKEERDCITLDVLPF